MSGNPDYIGEPTPLIIDLEDDFDNPPKRGDLLRGRTGIHYLIVSGRKVKSRKYRNRFKLWKQRLKTGSSFLEEGRLVHDFAWASRPGNERN